MAIKMGEWDCEAERLLAAYRETPICAWNLAHLGAWQAMVDAAIEEWHNDDGSVDVYLFSDGSIIADPGDGYEWYADLDTLLDATGWGDDEEFVAEAFDGWDEYPLEAQMVTPARPARFAQHRQGGRDDVN